jgi:hypothetical protein
MTKEDIIRMAREAYMSPTVFNAGDFVNWDDLHRFAALVAAAEREACAKVCEQSAQNYYPSIPEASGACTHLAAAIRARGQE